MAFLFIASAAALSAQCQAGGAITPASVPNGTVGVSYNVQLTENESFGMNPVTWGITAGNVPPGLTLDIVTMSTVTTISGTPTTPGMYSFTVSAEYNTSANQCSTQNYTINVVSPQQFLITNTSLPSGIVGDSYFIQLQTSGAGGTVTWFCSNAINGNNCPSLPPGLALNANSGVIAGTPTMSGVYPFTAVAEFNNSAPEDAMQLLSITIAKATPTCTPTISPDGSSPLPDGDVGITYPPVTIVVAGCPGPFMFSLVGSGFDQNPLPAGMTVGSNGTLSGKPGTVGTFTFDVAITGPDNYTNQIQYTLTIDPLPTITTQSPLPNGPVGVAYSQQIAATGGTPPYIFSMNNNPPGITITQGGVLNGTPAKAGTFSFNIGVTDSLRGQTTSPFEVTFAPAVAQILVAPLSLTFNADFQGNPPPTQAISVVPANGATPPVNFSVSVDNGQSGAAPSWITVSPTSAAAPAGLVVSVDQGAMAAGSYPARVRLTDSSGLVTDVAVTLKITSLMPRLVVAPGTLPITARSTAPGTIVENLLVANSGAGSLAFSTSVLGASSWIKGVTPSAGTTTRNVPVPIQVQVDTSGLQVGAYDSTIEVASSGGTVDVPVSLFVSASGPILGLDTTGVLFQPLHGGGSTATRTIEVLNLGESNSTVNWQATLVGGSTWLNLVSSNGTATNSTPGMLTLALAPNATQMAPGPYYTIIKITDANSLNSPQYVTAVLNLQPSSANPAPDVEPAGQFFTTTVGGAAPATQQVQVNTSSSSAVTFQVATLTADGGTWLKATPVTGNASGQTPGSVSVSVDPTGLAAGIYTGDVNISIGTSLQSVNITLVVQGSGANNSSISRLKPKAAGCTPGKLAITETGLADNFAVPAGWPATLIVQLNDDCSAPVSNGNVVASFSNGDAALNLAGDSLGNYSATWQPGSVNAEMVVTLNASAGTLQPATAKLYGGIAQNQTPPPTLNPNGTVNNLNPVAGAPLTPGTIAAVYGTGLGSMPVSTGVLPLRNYFDNTYALIGPAQAPLYFLSSGQINLQIPNEVTATQQVPIVLSVNNALTLPVMLNIVPAAPGLASYGGGKLIAQHANFSQVTSASPAKPGEVLIMYVVGMGATNPSVASGAPSPSSPLASVILQPTVTVDSQPAKVEFAGLTPGSVGLYQIDFQVPSNARTGNLNVTVTQNGVSANSATLPVSE